MEEDRQKSSKTAILPVYAQKSQSTHRRSSKVLVTVALCLSACVWVLMTQAPNAQLGLFRCHQHSGPQLDRLPLEGEIDWRDVDRGAIAWYACSDAKLKDFDCGRLVVPLDYTNPEDSRNASIALIRYRAGNGTTPRSDVKGSIIMNPGGPGGSGISLLTGLTGSTNLTNGEYYDNFFEGLFDIVSFDPRGVGQTTPLAKCFDSTEDDRSFQSFDQINGVLGSHAANKVQDPEFGAKIVESNFLADVCSTHGNNSDILKYMGTVSVCRDLHTLHEALDDPYLNYWGFSYGTVIGSVYTDMFPDDVGRVVLDGVVDVPNYLQGLWSHNMRNTEEEWQGFFVECEKAGPEHCRLAALNFTNADDLQHQVTSWLENLKLYPLSAVDVNHPRIVTWSMVMSSIFTAMYKVATWPKLAEDLYEAIGLGNISGIVSRAAPFSVQNLEPAIFAIACGDTLLDPSGGYTIEEYREHYLSVLDDSSTFARFFADLGPMCRGAWSVRAAERYYGNLTSTPRFPLLTLGNDYDPVTPAEFADEAAQRFSGSVSVRRGGYGHCSSSMPSECVKRIVRDYFISGQLPDAGTRCDTDGSPFLPTLDALSQVIGSQVFPLIG